MEYAIADALSMVFTARLPFPSWMVSQTTSSTTL